jgi:hypothetical protein
MGRLIGKAPSCTLQTDYYTYGTYYTTYYTLLKTSKPKGQLWRFEFSPVQPIPLGQDRARAGPRRVVEGQRKGGGLGLKRAIKADILVEGEEKSGTLFWGQLKSRRSLLKNNVGGQFQLGYWHGGAWGGEGGGRGAACVCMTADDRPRTR